jgi:hypothetical protein
MKSGDRRSLRSFSSEVFASTLPESVGYKKQKTPEGVFCFVGGAEGETSVEASPRLRSFYEGCIPEIRS